MVFHPQDVVDYDVAERKSYSKYSGLDKSMYSRLSSLSDSDGIALLTLCTFRIREATFRLQRDGFFVFQAVTFTLTSSTSRVSDDFFSWQLYVYATSLGSTNTKSCKR